ncbi:hypothetical protein [Neobacillus mesonae]|uniref:hypothetical protein n=1 Tax=Neobacillus mesonae TaxID=1193713 RepID=UPI002040CA5F|nr:hypothetical protein [Neobacillus mesonae]MCM3568069.1 hypothetical protein [Neobacillus mesonae]
MNTDQAFELLTDAGFDQEISIRTVRRWLSERKIRYEGVGHRGKGFIFNDSNKALNMLLDAGLTENDALRIAQRWLDEGKIQKKGMENKKNKYIPHEKIFQQSLKNPTEQDKTIHQLRVNIKALNEQITGMEQLHQTAINSLIKQRDQLNKEIHKNEYEKIQLQQEIKKLLQDNINLKNKLMELQEEISKGSKKEPNHKQEAGIPSRTMDSRQKLGLSKTASNKEILAGYKKLLLVTHPDHGGNAAVFHYIKSEYDYFRKSIKEQ